MAASSANYIDSNISDKWQVLLLYYSGACPQNRPKAVDLYMAFIAWAESLRNINAVSKKLIYLSVHRNSQQENEYYFLQLNKDLFYLYMSWQHFFAYASFESASIITALLIGLVDRLLVVESVPEAGGQQPADRCGAGQHQQAGDQV